MIRLFFVLRLFFRTLFLMSVAIKELAGCNQLSAALKSQANSLPSIIFGCHATYEVKIHVIYAYIYVGLRLKDVARTFGKPVSTISNWVQRFREEKEEGLLRKEIGNQHRKIFSHHRKWIEDYVFLNPLSYLHEIKKAFEFAFFDISISSIFRILVDCGITHRIIENRALEIQEEDIGRFVLEINSLAPILPQQLLFLDEMSIDNKGMLRKRGWFPKNTMPIWRASGTRSDRISVLSFLGYCGILDTDSVDGTFTRKKFFQSISKFIQSGRVEPYPGYFSLWIMDGAAIHLDPNIVNYLYACGVVVIFLPAYCPFYNPIEIVFATIKKYTKDLYQGRGTEEATLATALHMLKNTDMRAYFQKCGYLTNGKFNPFSNFPTLSKE